MTKNIYLDSCIFVAYFMKEKDKTGKLDQFFQEAKSSIDFVTSDWALTEVVKVLIKNKNIPPKKVAEHIQELIRTKRVGDIKFNWIQVNKKESYDFQEFFYEVQKVQLQYKGSLGDAIHAVIMKNNSIKTILTTDPEFDGIKGMIVINLLDKKEGEPIC